MTGATSVRAASKLPQDVVRHDRFNLAVIMTLIALTINFMATGTGFHILWASVMIYFVVDAVWVCLWPSCVKGAAAIITHHVLVAIYCIIPIYHPRYQMLMAVNMLVEINTWLLIAKRHYKSTVLEALFYFTWVTMRLIVYPYLVYYYSNLYMAHAEEMGTYWSVVMLAPLLQAYLSSLNFWWTITMVRQMLSKRDGSSSSSSSGKVGQQVQAQAAAQGRQHLRASSSASGDADLSQLADLDVDLSAFTKQKEA